MRCYNRLLYGKNREKVIDKVIYSCFKNNMIKKGMVKRYCFKGN